ncbi:MAG: hypothetical protein F6K35_24585 [Okeania sp. SIO2H7]|nr:hypothetical protein [Okeania sp. SIO2H7]
MSGILLIYNPEFCFDEQGMSDDGWTEIEVTENNDIGRIIDLIVGIGLKDEHQFVVNNEVVHVLAYEEEDLLKQHPKGLKVGDYQYKDKVIFVADKGEHLPLGLLTQRQTATIKKFFAIKSLFDSVSQKDTLDELTTFLSLAL